MSQSAPRSFSVSARIASFRHAFRGLLILLREQHNARLHLIATVLVIAAGLFFSLSNGEWVLVILAMGGVWLAEALNSAIEYLADALHPEQHPLIRNAKDVAAAAVLLFAVSALLVGLLVFVPHFLFWFGTD